MDHITYNQKEYSALGFGTTGLTKNNSLKGALSNLSTAYDLGITHFDTAPAYGFGNAEKIVGKFIKDKRDQVTITTKYGVHSRNLPMIALPVINILRSTARKILVRENKAGEKVSVAGYHDSDSIDVQGLKGGIEDSLRLLNTDYIDIFLLHEATQQTANLDEIISVLEKAKQEGKILNYGCGSDIKKLENKEIDHRHSILQFQDNAFDRNIENVDTKDRLIIRHGLFSKYNEARNFVAEQKEVDAYDLCFQHFKNMQNTMTIFSSSKNRNIKSTITNWNKHKAVPSVIWNNFINANKNVK